MAPLAKPVAPWIRQSHPLAQNLVAAWTFTEGSGVTVRDCGAMGLRDRDATAQGTPSWTAFSPYGRALTFDNATLWASLPINAAISMASQFKTTVAVLCIPTAANFGFAYVEESGGAFQFRLAIGINTVWQANFDASDNQSATDQLNGVAPTLNVPAHVLASFDHKAGASFLMVNGIVQATTSGQLSAATATTSQGISMGSERGAGFTGSVAAIFLWKGRALTQQEARMHYADPFGMFRRPHLSPIQSGSAAGGASLDAPGKIRHVIPDTFIRTIN